jgi:hypothetical protein
MKPGKTRGFRTWLDGIGLAEETSMRRVFLLLGCLLVNGCAATSSHVAIPMAAIDAPTERETTHELDALGTWSLDPEYGDVWTPNDASYVPYETNGEWIGLGDELTFVSDADWALPTYVRGRWFSRTTQAGPRWSWASHAKPVAIVPTDVTSRLIQPDPLRLADRAHVERALAADNDARTSESSLVAMHGSSHLSHAGGAHIGSSHFSGGHHGGHMSSHGHGHGR